MTNDTNIPTLSTCLSSAFWALLDLGVTIPSIRDTLDKIGADEDPYEVLLTAFRQANRPFSPEQLRLVRRYCSWAEESYFG